MAAAVVVDSAALVAQVLPEAQLPVPAQPLVPALVSQAQELQAPAPAVLAQVPVLA